MPRPYRLHFTREAGGQRIRLATLARLRSASVRRWTSTEYRAIVDTGSPICLLPYEIWESLQPPREGVIALKCAGLGGISNIDVGRIEVCFTADGFPTPVIEVRAG